MARARIYWTIIFILLVSACSPAALQTETTPAASPVRAVTLNVMAAASLTGAFEELGARFTAGKPGVSVQFNFAGSQQLAQQLAQGAPGDVFASANARQMDAAVKAGRIDGGAVRAFARNRLVIVYPRDNPASLKGIADLAGENIKLVLAARAVPVGQYSFDFLEKAAASGAYGADFKERVLAGVVSYEESVKSVLTKVALGEADAGIVYASDITGADADRVGQIAIPDDLNIIATYPIAVVEDSAHAELASQFIDLILSEEGQAILEKWGFSRVTP